jgi:hypothetical protein
VGKSTLLTQLTGTHSEQARARCERCLHALRQLTDRVRLDSPIDFAG